MSDRYDEEIAHWQAELVTATERLEQEPHDDERLRDYVLCHGRLGDLRYDIGELDRAAEHYRETLRVADEQLAADPTDSDWLH